MNNLQQGDIIVNEKGQKKILGVCGEVIFASATDSFEFISPNGGVTLAQLLSEGYKKHD
jgi:hypothetical protein